MSFKIQILCGNQSGLPRLSIPIPESKEGVPVPSPQTTWSPREWQRHVGHMTQVAGVRRSMITDTADRDIEVVQVTTGGGLVYDVMLSHGMDLGGASCYGIPLAWIAPGGVVSASRYEADGDGWLRTAGGGLMMTAGYDHIGPAEEVNGKRWGLHGRAHHLPSYHVATVAQWQEDDYTIRVSGEIRQAALFAENLACYRTVTSWMGRNVIRLEDRLVNEGFRSEPCMVLYHWNLGWPLVSDKTAIHWPEGSVRARDPHSPMPPSLDFGPPQDHCAEDVYLRTTPRNADWIQVSVRNPHVDWGDFGTPITVTLRYHAHELPHLIEWRARMSGVYALGIEPANADLEGFRAASESGRLRVLEPGEALEHHLEFSVGCN